MCAVPNMLLSVISCFPSMLLRHFLSDFEVVPLALIVTGITSVTFHMNCISIVRSLFTTMTTVATTTTTTITTTTTTTTTTTHHYVWSILC